MTVPAAVRELVERFDAHKDAYMSGQYNEAQLREEFLNPFFVALGWDMYNEKGYADAYKEVIHEDALKMGGRTKAPDYCFRAGGGMRSFFVEAKKPSVDIGEAISPAFQLRRYAWSAKLPVSVLTDFEEFAVYDCRIRPDKNDKASAARVLFVKFTEYIDRWDELVGLFTPEAIRRGSLEKFVSSKKAKKGTAQVDVSFLEEIESWRLDLARNLAMRNPGLSQRDLNFAVQRTIDRMIFLRICEDRGIEPYGTLQTLQNAPNIYLRLGELFQRADSRYNSGLFHFAPEKDRPEPPDEITLALKIDDKPLADILQRLYFPDSPYEFSVLPIEILGQVYEQFLGKVIRLTEGHRAKVEEKPEVRKAGGVYYTPAYIVDYIVKHTVGKLLGDESSSTDVRTEGGRKKRGITPAQASKLHILDPACGSGSFLIGAYRYLLDWHLNWYLGDGAEKHARGRAPKLYRGPAGDWRLTTAEKKRILLNNIYGVDIDAQAVEVTKLSLLLKVLEGESGETLANQLRIFHERALPDLAGNIKCGNSLISTDFFNGHQLSLFGDEERYRINAFDWKHEEEGFGAIMAAGGFDAVIGNPPWVMAGYYLGSEMNYLKRHYVSAEGKFDLYYLFVELGIRLLNDDGRVGVIVPNKFFHTRAAQNLRTHLASGRYVHELVDFGCEKVFAGATNYACITLLRRVASKNVHFARTSADLTIIDSYNVRWSHLNEMPWHFAKPRAMSMFRKMEAAGCPLADMVQRFGTGIQTGADKILCVDAEIIRNYKLERTLLRPILRGRNVRRYELLMKHKHVVFPYYEDKGQFVAFEEKRLRSEYPRMYSHLVDNKKSLAERVWFGKSAKELSGEWYGMMYLDSPQSFASAHLLTPSLSNRSNFTLGNGSLFVTGTAGVTSIIPKDNRQSILYLLGILNSSLISFYVTQHSPVFQGAYYKFSAPYLKNIPIRTIDFTNRKDKSHHDRMVDLVETMLKLHNKVAAVKTPHEKTAIGRLVSATDQQIDRLVYELYGLTDEEIKIVEGVAREA